MNNIAYIDAHTHANSRSSEDFERLAVAGCVGLVAVAGDEGGFRGPDSVLDHFQRLDRVDRVRVEQAGVKCYLALGVHPRGIPGRGLDELLDGLGDALDSYRADAIGEIGLEQGGDDEERALLGQLGLAAERDLPAIVHTPRKGKAEATLRCLELIDESGIPPAQVLLDHLDETCLDRAVDSGCYLGLSVHPAKLSPAEACSLVAKTDPARLVLSTDMGSNPSYLFGLPAAICAMQDHGLAEAVIRAVVHDNAAAFLGISS